MGILYEVTSFNVWAIWLFVLFALMAFNELGRTTKWGGLVLFLIVPVMLTIFVWPTTAAPGNEYGTGTWFNWVKTYSALAGCLGFMAIRFIPGLAKKNGHYAFRPSFWHSIFLKHVFVISNAIHMAHGTERI
jgi:hypothetical protein